MNTTVDLYGKSVSLQITPAADRQIAARKVPLLVEMELRFSCLVAKRIYFKEATEWGISIPVTPGLHINFRAVITSTCAVPGSGGAAKEESKAVAKLKPYVPKWCRIDYLNGEWCGEFGYENAVSA